MANGIKARRASFNELLGASELVKANIESVGDGFYRYTNGYSDEKVARELGISIFSVQHLRQQGMKMPIFKQTRGGKFTRQNSGSSRLNRLEKIVEDLRKIVADHDRIMKDLGA